MLAWITENIGTILISAVLLLIVVLIIVKLVKDTENRKIQLWLQLCPLRHVGLLPPEVTKQQAGRRGWKHLRFPFALTGGKQWLTKTH